MFVALGAPHTNLPEYEPDHRCILSGDLIVTEFPQGFRREEDDRKAQQIM